MFEFLSKYLQIKSKERLLKQWAEHGDLSSEQAQLNSLGEERSGEEDLDDDEIQRPKIRDYPALSERDRVVSIPVRYVVILLSIIMVLAIALSVVVTVLVMRD